VTTAEDKHGQSVVYSLGNPQPVQVAEQTSDIVVLRSVTDEARSCIENGLEPVQQVDVKENSRTPP